LRQDPQIESLVAEKAAKDDAKVAELVASGVKAVRVVYQDGGQHPDFHARVAEVSRPEALVAPPIEIALEEKAAKFPIKTAAKSPVVTLAAAKARAKAETAVAAASAQPQVAAVAPAAETASEPARLVALAAGAGAIGGWLGLHKDEAIAPASPAAAEVKPEPAPVKAAAPSPPRRAGEAAAKKPQASLPRKEPQAPAAKEPQATLHKEPHARAATPPSSIATASLRDGSTPLPQPLRP
jgi:hypothetical protein